MTKTSFHTTLTRMSADAFTPVGIYLRLRDRFRDSILLESNDFHGSDNSYSFIGIKAIAGIELSSARQLEYRLPGAETKTKKLGQPAEAMALLDNFLKAFQPTGDAAGFPASVAQGLFGYLCYDALQVFENIRLQSLQTTPAVPLLRYRFYQYVIAINHFKDELYLIENHVPGVESEKEKIETLIRSRDIPVFPFAVTGDETSQMTDADYMTSVEKGIQHCHRGDVFQVVLGRQFAQPFTGDEFNVYRALRSVNPGPYLFYFDYGNYRLFGSSPESQLIIDNGEAIIHPIAGTIKRTGDDAEDAHLAGQLINDPKENAEHVMLVDLARNDLSRFCEAVDISHYKQLKYYSHLIHLVSEVKGRVTSQQNSLSLMGQSFPAGTLSGAPKHRAMQIIDELEGLPRGFYGGAIGMLGFNGYCNHAIMIRTFLSRNNELVFRAGAGIVAGSKPANELKEVSNKLAALRTAIQKAAGQNV
jgi:anthranilate synthase component I